MELSHIRDPFLKFFLHSAVSAEIMKYAQTLLAQYIAKLQATSKQLKKA